MKQLSNFSALTFLCFALVHGHEIKALLLRILPSFVSHRLGERSARFKPDAARCSCVFKRREGEVVRVLSDSERVNTKLISLFQGILPVMSETVLSRGDSGSAVQ